MWLYENLRKHIELHTSKARSRIQNTSFIDKLKVSLILEDFNIKHWKKKLQKQTNKNILKVDP